MDRFSKNIEIKNLIKIHPVTAELFVRCGQTDVAKLVVAFRIVVKAPKNLQLRDML